MTNEIRSNANDLVKGEHITKKEYETQVKQEEERRKNLKKLYEQYYSNPYWYGTIDTSLE